MIAEVVICEEKEEKETLPAAYTTASSFPLKYVLMIIVPKVVLRTIE